MENSELVFCGDSNGSIYGRVQKVLKILISTVASHNMFQKLSIKVFVVSRDSIHFNIFYDWSRAAGEEMKGSSRRR